MDASPDLLVSLDSGIIESKAFGFLTGNSGRFFTLLKEDVYNLKLDDGTTDFYGLANGHLFGIDRYGRRFFNIGNKRLLITDKNGEILKIYKFKEDLDPSVFVSWPTISHDGDIYYIESSPKEHKLIKIPSLFLDATTNEKHGSLNDSDVRLRADPKTTGAILKTLGKGIGVNILDQTKDTQTINGKTAVWLKVRLTDGTEGWVFGAFIDVQK